MCVFCSIINREIPSEILYEDEDILAILDISQVTYGHTLVIPKKHVADFLHADDTTVTKCMLTARDLAARIVRKTGAAGVNILTNCGEAAGQSVSHMHIHIIPRYDETDAIDLHFGQSGIRDLKEVHAALE